MANFLLFAVFLTLGTLKLGNGMSVFNGVLSNTELKIISQYPCEEAAIFNPEIVVRPGDSFDFTGELETQMDNTYQLLVQIDKFVRNKWLENFLNTRGNLCDILNKYLKKAWEKFRLATNPQITDSCVIPEGKHVTKDLSLSTTDLGVPTAFFGLWRIFIRVYNSDGELFMCQVLEAEIQKKIL